MGGAGDEAEAAVVGRVADQAGQAAHGARSPPPLRPSRAGTDPLALDIGEYADRTETQQGGASPPPRPEHDMTDDVPGVVDGNQRQLGDPSRRSARSASTRGASIGITTPLPGR